MRVYLRRLTVMVVIAAVGGLIPGGSVQAGNTDIFDAARAGDIDAINSYIENGGEVARVNDRSHTPFILAAYYGHNSALAPLIKAGADPCAIDDKGSNAMMGVAFRGHDDTARWLLANTSCAVDHRNYADQTALMMAALFGREAIVALLLDAGANPEATDAAGNSAKSLAARQGLSRVVKMLRFSLR